MSRRLKLKDASQPCGPRKMICALTAPSNAAASGLDGAFASTHKPSHNEP